MFYQNLLACRFSLLILALFLIPPLGFGQQYKVKYYTQESGLQNELVKSISVDTIGFIWAGTDNGLIRFNGNEFIDYADKLSSNYVKSIICDEKGRLFVNTDLGFEEITYTKKKVKFNTILKGGTSQSDSLLWYPKQFYEDHHGNLWFSDNATVYRFSKNKLNKYVLGPENSAGSYVHSFSFFKHGANRLILVSNSGNIFAYNYQNDVINPVKGSRELGNITGLVKIAEGHILIGSNDKLGEVFFDENANFLNYRVLNTNIDASSFLRKADGSVFIGSWTSGLWEAQLIDQKVSLKKIDEISSRGAINQIITYGNEYILATDYGIIILQNQMFISPYESITNQYIQDIVYDPIHKKILFTDGRKIVSVDEQSLDAKIIFETSTYLILEVLVLNKQIWFADNQGFLRQLTNGLISRTIDLSNYGTSIYNLISDQSGNMWLCQDNLKGVIRIDKNYTIKVIGEDYGLDMQINFIKNTPYQHLLLGTNHKDKYLLYYDPVKDTVINMSHPINLDNEATFSVNDIIFNESKVLWIASNQGVFMVKGTDISRINLEFQSKDDIKAITLDKQNNIWFASSSGVSKYDGKNIIPFDHLDGLPSKTIAFRSILSDSKNRVWAGTLSGIAYTLNNQDPLVTSRPVFLTISEKGIPIENPANANFNNLTYLTFNFISPEYPTNRINYLVKMSNKDKDWRLLIGKNEVFYTDMDKGDYQLMIKARQHGNYLWSEPLVYNFKIHTVWYQSWISWSIFGVAIVLLVVLLTKLRSRSLENEKTTLNKLVLERTRKLENTTREIEAKNKQLIIAKEEAERSSRVKADFLSTMSHEIRTPLNGVLGNINLLLLEDPRKDQMDKINTMKFSAENLLTLINDILDFNKIDEGKLKLESVDFNLIELIKNVKAGFDPMAGSKKIALILQLDQNIPEQVIGDPTRLTQIITNLLGNAVKFTEKGEVKLSISSRKLPGNSVEIYFKIIDSGIGISPQQLQNIFESFSQASSDTTRKYGGSGLGLAISKKLLDIMGSRIQVKSKQGVGSEFLFKLIFEKGQAKSIESSDEEQESEPEVRNLKGLKVLLVEDNKINTRIAKQMLEKWEIEVEWAEDGQAAINKFKPGKYDLIFMDLHMPIVDGFEATRAIRKIDQKIPIVALTAAIKIQDKNKVLEAGMNEFVSKPFKPKELFALISKLTFNESNEVKNKKLKSTSGFESLKGYKILLVEDNDINIKIATQFLEKWDIEVEVAKDGQIAIDMFEVDKYHLILMDLHLPNVDGYQATKEIRMIDKNIPIIALTAAAQVQDKEKVLTEGMNDFISKPFSPKDLYNKITNGLMNAMLKDE